MKTACFLTLALTLSAYGIQHEGQAPAGGKPEPKKPVTDKPAEEKRAPDVTRDKSGSQLRLTGIKMIVPAGWETQTIQPGALAPKAVYQIPAIKAGEEPGMVRVTQFPEMKGKDDQNIDRWIAQVAKADGAAATRADAKVEKIEMGSIRLTTLDISGSVKMTMRDTAKPDHRMIAAIVDHPKGPHFIVIAGPAASMKTWEPDIMKFLKSAEITDK